MKKALLLTALILAVAFSSGAGAQMMGGGTDPLPQDMPDRMDTGMMGGCGMGYGMMGGYGMGPRMMEGYGMGPGMMEGYGMGPGMMGNYGYGMGPGMRGGYGFGRHMHGNCNVCGMGRSKADQEKFRKFLDGTRDLRKKLYDMRFDYREMLRNPDTTMKEKMEMEKKMFDLRQQIMEKAPQ